jgi:predicted nucleotidyltransferase
MNVLGIIAEYNPFHNGHLYQLQESSRITAPDFTVCVMSGNFMQRGEPAMADKWLRAETAVKNGIDLVMELPFAFACNNAEYFAYGAVDLLDRLGCVTHLSFGSEAGDLAALQRTAEFLSCESDELKECIRENAGLGMSFPKARYEAVRQCAGEDLSEHLKSANNILAVEYLKQLNLKNSPIEPVTVMRYGTGYHDKGSFENIASATAIRHKISESGDTEVIKSLMPISTFQVLNRIGYDVNKLVNDLFKLLVYRIITSDHQELASILSATEGLENRVKNAVSEASDMESLVGAILSKRYTETRIRRLLSHILIGLDKEAFQEITDKRINYARVLGFNRKGAELLKLIKKTESSSIPILTNINRELTNDSEIWKLLKYDVLASDIYNLAAYGDLYAHSDHVRKPYKDYE